MGNLQSSLTPEDLLSVVGSAACPKIVDVRRLEAFGAAPDVLPGAVWRDHRDAASWGREIADSDDIVVYCVHGHQVSQSAAALLRGQGVGARYLAGGIEAYREAGGITIKTSPGLQDRKADASHWAVATDADLDRLVRVWFVRRFLDPAAQLHFVEADWVDEVAAELGGRPIRPKPSEQDAGGTLNDFFLSYSSGDAVLRDFARILETSQADDRRLGIGVPIMIEGLFEVFDDDAARVSAALPVFDAIYAGCRRRASAGSAPKRS